MKTVILEVREPEAAYGDFSASWKSGTARRNSIGFASPELLWKVLTAKRWELLKALCGAGPVPIREAARRVDRDVKAVHADVTALINAGLLRRIEGEGIEFPYDAVKVEFLLSAVQTPRKAGLKGLLLSDTPKAVLKTPARGRLKLRAT